MINKFICLLISIMLLVGCTASALADVQFDPSNYTKEELLTIDAMIVCHLRNTKEGNIIYDENGMTIEFLGIGRTDYGYYVVELLITNESADKVYAVVDDLMINRCTVSRLGAFFDISSNSVYSTKINGNAVFEPSDLESYGIKSIERVDFSISLLPYLEDGTRDSKRRADPSFSIVLDEPYPVEE